MDADLLRRAGFSEAGHWMLDGERLRFVPATDFVDATHAVYAFARGPAQGGATIRQTTSHPKTHAHTVTYVGHTDRLLTQRLANYAHPHSSQSTNIRLNGLIRAQLQAGANVAVLAAWPGMRKWNALPVQLHVGLEAGLIELARPAWNAT